MRLNAGKKLEKLESYLKSIVISVILVRGGGAFTGAINYFLMGGGQARRGRGL